MSEFCLNSGLILGCGGRRPGIRLIVPESEVTTKETLLSLPASIYAVDIDPIRGLAACATRAGTIHLFQFEAVAEESPPREIARLLHGRSVLSVGFTGDGGLVSADDSGQVLCWRKGRESAPERWLSDGPVICSLSSQAELQVIGLGVGGQLIVWDTQTGNPVKELVGLPPVSPIALARLTSWTPGGCPMLVYPAQDGQFVLIRTDPPLVRSYRIHEGRFYAAFQIEDHLVTIGHDDGIAKLWQWADDKLIRAAELPAFPGVIDAKWNVQADPPSGVAVLAGGNAVGFTMTRQGLQAHGPIPGDGYRVVAAPSDRLRRQAIAHQAERRAADLQQRLTASIESGDTAEIDDGLLELERLGYRAASLNLQAQRAWRAGDELAELQALHQLAPEWCVSDRPVIQPLLGRYMDLLLRYRQIELAVDVLDRIERVHPGLGEVLEIQGPRRAVEAMQAGRTLVHEAVAGPEEVDKTIRAARILAALPKGLWELHRSPAMLLPEVELCAERLAKTLRACREVDPQQIGVVAGPVLWMHGRTCEEEVSVLLPAFEGHQNEYVRIALRLAAQPTGSTVTRSILLNPNATEPGWLDREVVALATQLQDEAARAALFAPVNDWIVTTLRKIRGTALASALNPLGGVA